MSEKLTVAINWAGACGGCDLSILDLAEGVLDLVEFADIVYWPVAMDYKRSDLESRADGSIDVGVFNGRCFLEQGLLCMGPATRGGCGQTCIRVNMPCRGCYGPTPGVVDPGAEAMSAIGSMLGVDTQVTPAHVFKTLVRSVRDPVGTFYRYTLPSAILGRVVDDRPEGEA